MSRRASLFRNQMYRPEKLKLLLKNTADTFWMVFQFLSDPSTNGYAPKAVLTMQLSRFSEQSDKFRYRLEKGKVWIATIGLSIESRKQQYIFREYAESVFEAYNELQKRSEGDYRRTEVVNESLNKMGR